jgi:hypothetical protein
MERALYVSTVLTLNRVLSATLQNLSPDTGQRRRDARGGAECGRRRGKRTESAASVKGAERRRERGGLARRCPLVLMTIGLCAGSDQPVTICWR